ncbi:hypothetical protein ACNS7O_06480 [Haloferacaceae archaeon DSL9]
MATKHRYLSEDGRPIHPGYGLMGAGSVRPGRRRSEEEVEP